MHKTMCFRLALVVTALATVLLFAQSPAVRGPSAPPAMPRLLAHDAPLETYETVLGRRPPDQFAEFIRYAHDNGCSTNLRHYRQIFVDMAQWHEHGGIWREDLPPDALISNTSHINGGLYKDGNLISEGGLSFGDDTHSGLLRPVLHLLTPSKPFQYAISWIDTPTCMPSDDTSDPYFDMFDAFEKNPCLRRAYGRPDPVTGLAPRDVHATLLNPWGFTVKNARYAVFGPNKFTDCGTDMMVPMLHHVNAAKPLTMKVEWKDKLNVLFWRGSSTSGQINKHTPWHSFHRIRLLEWERKFKLLYPNRTFDAGADKSYLNMATADSSSIFKLYKDQLLVDIGLDKFVQIDDNDIKEEIKSRYGLKKFVELDDYMHFKYLVVVDGNAWPARLQTFLRTNSLIFYGGIFVDYYIGLLVPWVHYVPIKVDLSDLLEKVQWAMTHDKEAQKIVQNAMKLMTVIGSPAQMRCYTGLAFMEYQSLYRSKVD
ncbi:F-actin-capping protein subunit alpha [Entophlyctis sp. JEL0112]|nr:F-actin-capping protein subunit alpha [Entophlyctis sp. JEL0112]